MKVLHTHHKRSIEKIHHKRNPSIVETTSPQLQALSFPSSKRRPRITAVPHQQRQFCIMCNQIGKDGKCERAVRHTRLSVDALDRLSIDGLEREVLGNATGVSGPEGFDLAAEERHSEVPDEVVVRGEHSHVK
eukprot:111847-Rhodomonas_salina.1